MFRGKGKKEEARREDETWTGRGARDNGGTKTDSRRDERQYRR